jgi:hypothetical protein
MPIANVLNVTLGLRGQELMGSNIQVQFLCNSDSVEKE